GRSIAVGVAIQCSQPVLHFAADNGARDPHRTIGVAKAVELLDAALDITALWWSEGAPVPPLPRKQAEMDPSLQDFGHRLRGYLDVSKKQDCFQLVIGKIAENFVIFLHEEAVSGFAQHRTLLGEIQECHISISF